MEGFTNGGRRQWHLERADEHIETAQRLMAERLEEIERSRQLQDAVREQILGELRRAAARYRSAGLHRMADAVNKLRREGFGGHLGQCDSQGGEQT